MKPSRLFTGVLFIACAASTSARAVPFIAPVFGTPVVGIDFANSQFDVSISSEPLLGPTVTETRTGGGVVNSNLSAFSDGLHGSATLDLVGPGFAGVTMSAKLRTTVTTLSAPEFPPLSPQLVIGPNTFVDLQGLGDVRFTLSYALLITAFPGEGDFDIVDSGGNYECVQSGDRVCSTFFDIATADTFFRLTPGSPIVYDTSLRYSVSLESLPVRIAEPASGALIALPLILLLIGLPWSAGRRQAIRGEAP